MPSAAYSSLRRGSNIYTLDRVDIFAMVSEQRKKIEEPGCKCQIHWLGSQVEPDTYSTNLVNAKSNLYDNGGCLILQLDTHPSTVLDHSNELSCPTSCAANGNLTA